MIHLYVSTYCQHEQHSDCRLSCKICKAPCLCPCHSQTASRVEPVPVSGLKAGVKLPSGYDLSDFWKLNR
jgi:hypothetical protein